MPALYKVLYSLAFAVILSIARGVTHTYEVGIACEAPMALLASVFCADTYVQEIASRRSEVWRMYPMKRKVMCIFRRARNPGVLSSAAGGSRLWDVLPVSGSPPAVRPRDGRGE